VTPEINSTATRLTVPYPVPFLNIAGSRIEYQLLGMPSSARAPIVLLHEGLGSISTWRDFPTELAAAAQHPILVYSRKGCGRSSPLTRPRTVGYLHEEALEVLPELLDSLSIRSPILVGHSDGASIALIHAGARIRPVSGLILLAPHVFVEDVTVATIARVKSEYGSTNLASRLARHHDDAPQTFGRWSDIWLNPEFQQWNIEEYLPDIECPVLVIQGEDDEYGTIVQVERIVHAVPNVRTLLLERCGHAPHRDRRQETLLTIARFVALVNTRPAF
jgi:pimeloyl-ACP methyl ester carboxylesterase